MAEEEWRPLDPAVMRLWRQHLGPLVLTVVVVGFVVVAVAIVGDGAEFVLAGVVTLLAATVALAVMFPPRRYRTWSYRLGPEALEIRRGVLFRVRSVIPYFRVQNVELSSGPLERRLGLVRLHLRTAAPGTDAEIPGLREADALEARARILERAGDTTGV